MAVRPDGHRLGGLRPERVALKLYSGNRFVRQSQLANAATDRPRRQVSAPWNISSFAEV